MNLGRKGSLVALRLARKLKRGQKKTGSGKKGEKDSMERDARHGEKKRKSDP